MKNIALALALTALVAGQVMAAETMESYEAPAKADMKVEAAAPAAGAEAVKADVKAEVAAPAADAAKADVKADDAKKADVKADAKKDEGKKHDGKKADHKAKK